MGGLTQLGLLIWKHLLRRLRQPGILALEYLWPVVLFLVLVALRQAWTPEKFPTCYRSPRAMPSAGGLIFLQNYLCNMGNECMENDTSSDVPGLPGLAKLSNTFSPLVASAQQGHNIINDLDGVINVLNPIEEQLEKNPAFQGILELNITVGNLFREPDYVEYYMVDVLRIANRSEARALLDASVNVNKIIDMLKEPDAMAVICNSTRLQQYLVFPPEVNVTLVSQSLCRVNSSNVKDFTNVIVGQIDVQKILDIASRVSGATGSYTLSRGLRDVANMLDMVGTSRILGDMSLYLEATSDLTTWLRRAADLLTGVNATTLDTLENVVSMMQTLTHSFPGAVVSDEVIDMMKVALDVFKSLWHWSHGAPLEFPAYLQPMTYSAVSALYNMSLPGASHPVGNVTVAELQRLLNTPVEHSKLEPLLIALSKSQDPMTALCSPPGLADVFIPATAADAQAIEETMGKLCALSYTDLLSALGVDQATIDSLMPGYQMQMALMSVDWTQIMSNGTALEELMQMMAGYLEPIVSSMDNTNFTELWDTVAASAETLEMLMASPVNQSALLSHVDSVHMRLLRLFPETAAELEPMIFAMGPVLQYGVTFVQHMKATVAYIQELLLHDPAMTAAISTVLRQGLPATSNLLSYFTQEETIMALATNSSGLQSTLCNMTWLEMTLGMDPAVPADAQGLAQVSKAFCINLPHNVSDLERLMDTDALAKEAELAIGILWGEVDVPPRYTTSQISTMIQNITSYNLVADLIALGEELERHYPVSFTSQEIAELENRMINFEVYTGVRMIVTSVGESLEKTSLWPAMEPKLSTMYQTLHVTNIAMEGLRNSNLEQVSVLLIRYGPQLIKAYMEKMYRLLEAGSLPTTTTELTSMFCGETGISLGLPSYMYEPLEQLQGFVCKTSASEWEREIHIVTNAIQQSSNMTFSWNGLVSEAKKQFDLWNAYPGTNVIYTLGEAMEHMNMTAWTEVMMMSMAAMQNTDIMVPVLTTVDEMMGNDTGWNDYKHMLNQSMAMMEANMLFMEQMQDGGIPLSSFMSNGSKMQEMMIAAMETAPEVIDMVEDVIVNPVQMMQSMMNHELHNMSLCANVRLTDVMTFNDPAAINSLETMLCNFNMTEMMAEMMEMPYAQQYMEMMENMSVPRNSSEPVQMDWGRAMTMMSHMMNMSSSDMSWLGQVNWLPNVDPRYMEAIQNSINSLVATVNQANMDSYGEVLRGMDAMMTNLTSNMEGVAEVYKWQAAYSEGAAHLINFINTHLRKHNGSTVSVVNYLQSTEFTRMLSTAVVESPDLIHVLIYSAEVLMNDTMKAGAAQASMPEFCTNDAVAASIITIPPTVNMTIAEVRGILCLFNFSADTFLQELMTSIDGFSDLVSDFERLSLGSNMSLSSSAMYLNETINQMVALLKDNPPTMSLGVNEAFLDSNHWQGVWSAANNFGNVIVYSPDTVATFLSSLFAVMGDIPLSLIDQMGLRELVAWEDAVFGELVIQLGKLLNGTVSVEDLLQGRPETKKFYDQIVNAPALFSVFAHTVIKDANVLQPMFEGHPLVLCSQDTAFSFPPDPALIEAFWNIHGVLCSANYTALQIELNGLVDVRSIMNVANQPAPLPVNLTSFNHNIFGLVKLLVPINLYYANLSQLATEIVNLADGEMWLSALTSLGQTTSNIESLSQQINTLLPLLEEMGTDTQVLISVSQMLLKAGTTLSGAIHDPMGLLNNSTELQTVNAALANLPMFLHSVLATLTGPNAEAFVTLLASGANVCHIDFKDVMTVPAGSNFDVTDFIVPLCTVDIQKILDDHLPFAVDVTTNMTAAMPSSGTSDLVQQITRFQQELGMMINKGPAFVNVEVLYNAFPWLNATEYLSIKTFIDQTLMLPQTTDPAAIDNYLQHLLNMIDLTSMLPASYTNTMYSTLTVMNGKLDGIIQGGSVSGSVLFPNSPNMQRLLDLTGDLPHLVAIFMMSASRPQFTQLVSMNLSEISYILCVMNDPLSNYLTQLPTPTYDLTHLQTQFCQLDANALMREFQTEFNITDMQENAINQSMLMGAANGFYSRINHLAANPPTVALNWEALNETVWTEVLMQWAMTNTNAQMQTDMVMPLLTHLLGNHSSDEVLQPYMDGYYQALLVIHDKLQVFMNGGNVTLNEVFPNSPNLHKLLEMSRDFQDLMGVLAASVHTQQFQQLLTMDAHTASFLLCQQQVPLSTYLTVPSGSTYDLTQLQNYLCVVNWTMIAQELSVEFNVTQITDYILGQVPDATPANVTAMEDAINTLNEGIGMIVANPPTLQVDLPWLDGSVWHQALEQMSQLLMAQNVPIEEQLSNYIQSLFSVVTSFPESADYIKMVYTIITNLHGKLTDISTAGSLSIPSLLPDSPNLQRMLAAAGDLPDLVSVLVASAPTPQFQTLLAMPPSTAMQACESGTPFIHQYLTVPPGSNIDLQQFQQLLCRFNLTALEAEFTNEFTKDMSMSTVTEAMFTNALTTVYTDMAHLVANPPVVHLNWTTLNDTAWVDAIMLWAQMYSNTQHATEMSLNQLNSMVGMPVDAAIQPYINGIYHILQVVNNKLEIFMSRGTVTLDNLFPDSPNIRDFLVMAGDLHSLMGVLAASSNTPQFHALLAMDVNTTLRKLCLEEVPLSEYLQVPNGSSYNLLTLQSHICQIKWNDVTMELSREFNITQITMYLTEQMNSTMNVEPMMMEQEINRFYNTVGEIAANPPALQMDWPWLNGSVWHHHMEHVSHHLAAHSMSPEQQLQNYIGSVLAMTSALPEDYAKVLHGIISNLNTKLSDINTETVVSVSNLFPNSPNIQRLLAMTSDLPELLTVLIASLPTPQFQEFLSITAEDLMTQCMTGPLFLDSYITVPQGSDFNLYEFQRKLCGLNIVSLTMEFQDEMALNTTPMSPVSETMWNNTLATFYTELTHVVANPPAVQLDWMMLNDTAWMDAIMLWAQINSNTQHMTDMSLNQLSSLTGMPIDATIQPYLNGIHYILQVVNNKLHVLMNGGTVTLAELFPKSPNVQDFLVMVGDLQSILGVLTASANTPQFQELLMMDMNTTLRKLCAEEIPLSRYLQVPSGSNYSLSTLQQQLCAIKWDDIVTELSNEFNVTQISMRLLGQADNTMNVNNAMIEQEINRFYNNVGVIGMNPPMLQMNWPWLNGSVWLHILDQVSQQLVWEHAMEQQIQMYVTSMMDVLNSIQPDMPVYFSQLHATVSFVNSKLDNVLRDGILSSYVLFPDSPHIQQLLNATRNLPGLMAVAITSASTPQFQSLLSRDVTMLKEELCVSRVPLSTYITVPHGSNFNLTQLQNELCKMNLTALEMEFNNEFNILPTETNGTDSATLLEAMMGVYDRIGRLAANPPRLPMDWDLLNSTAWTNTMMLWATAYNDPMQALNMATSQLNTFQGMAQDPANQNFLNALHHVFHVLNTKMLILTQGGTLTLQDIFPVAPNLRQFLNMFGDLPYLLGVVMQSADTPGFKQILTMDASAFMQTICVEEVPLSSYLTAPNGSSYDVNTLQTYLCMINWEAIVSEMSTEFDIPQLAALLEGQVEGAQNVSAAEIENEANLFANYSQQVTMNPPTVLIDWPMLNVSVWMQTLEHIARMLGAPDAMTLEEQTALYVGTLVPTVALGTIQAYAPDLNRYLNGLQAILTVSNMWLHRLNSGPVLNLTQLFPDSPNLHKVLIAAGDLPGIIEALMNNENAKFQELVQIIEAGNGEDVLCVQKIPLSNYVTLPAGSTLDLEKLQLQICAVNFTALLHEMSQIHQMDYIQTRFQYSIPVDETALITSVTDFYNNLDQLYSSPPQLHMGWNWLNDSVWLHALETWGHQYVDPQRVLNVTFSQILPVLEYMGNDSKAAMMKDIMSSLQMDLEVLLTNASAFTMEEYLAKIQQSAVPILMEAFTNSSMINDTDIIAAMDELLRTTNWTDWVQVSEVVQKVLELLYDGQGFNITQNYVAATKIVMEYILDMSSSSRRMSVSQMLGNYSYIWNTVQTAVEFQPELIVELMQVSVQLDRINALWSLSTEELSTLACNVTNLSRYFVWPSGTDIGAVQSAFCNFNSTAFIEAMSGAIDVNGVMSRVVQALSAPRVSDEEFDAVTTRFVENMMNYTSLIAKNLEQLDGGNLTMAIDQWWQQQRVGQSGNHTFDSLRMTLGSLMDMLDSFNYQYQDYEHVIVLWNSILSPAMRYLQELNENNTVSLSTIVGNSTQLEAVLFAVLQLDNATIQALLHSQMPAQMVGYLLNPDNITLNVCLGDVMSTWELPVDVNVTMQQLRAAICAVEPNDLLQAIVNHIDLDNFIEIMANDSWHVDVDGWSEISNETLTLVELLMNLPSMTQPVLAPNLVELEEIVHLMPVLVQAIANYSMEGGLEGLLLTMAGNVSSMIPQLEQVSQVVGGLMMMLQNDLDFIQNSSSVWMPLLGNSTAMSELYMIIMSSYQNISSDILQQIMYNLTLSNMERLVMVHGRAPLCDHDVINVAMETAYPMGAPSGMNVSNVQHILCNTTVDTWIDDLQNMTGVNLTDIWPLMDQLSQSLVTLSNSTIPPSQWMDYLQDHLEYLSEDMDDLLAVLPPELHNYVDYAYWESLVNNISKEIDANNMPNMTWLETLLGDLDKAFGNDSAWQEMLHVADAAAMYLQAINNQMMQGTLSLSELLGDPSAMEAWLIASLGNDTGMMEGLPMAWNSSQSMSPSSEIRSPWQTLINQTHILVNNLLTIGGSVDAMSSNITGWLDQMEQNMTAIQARWVHEASSNCGFAAMLWDDLMMNHSLSMSSIIWYQYGAMNLTWMAQRLMPEVSSTLCSLQTASLSDVAALMNSTLFTGFMDQLVRLMAGPTSTSEECTDLMQISKELSTAIEEAAPTMVQDVMMTLECVANTSGMIVPMFQEIDKLSMMLRELHHLLRTAPQFNNLPMDEIEPYLRAIISGLESQPDIEEIVNILNSAGLTETVMENLNIPQEVASAFMEFLTESNLTTMMTTNLSMWELQQMVCVNNRDLMMSINISDAMCVEILNITVQTVEMYLRPLNGTGSVDFQWLQQLLKHIVSAMEDFSLLSDLSSLLTEVDIDRLIELLPQMEEILFNKTFAEIIRHDVQILLNDLERVLPGPLMSNLSRDIMTMIDGILGISVVGDHLPQSVAMHEILKNPAALRNYTMTQLNMSSEVIDALLDATFPFSSLVSLYASDPVSSIICNSSVWADVLNATDEATSAMEAMCQENLNTTANFSQAFIDQLDIGHYIAAWLSVDSASMMASMNISTERLRETTENFLPVAEALTSISPDRPNSVSISDILQQGLDNPGSLQQQVSNMGSFLCGNSEAFQLSDPSGMLQTSNNETWTEEQQKDMEAFPTQFCKDLYKEMQRLGDAGRVLWTLLKPMINGQVLYSPDTPETRAIMKEAQWMLDGLRTLENVTQEWSKALSNFTLNVSNGYGNLLAALDNPTISDALSSQLGISAASLSGPLSFLSSVTPADVKNVHQLTQFIHDLSQCVTTKFVAVASEEEMQAKADKLRETNSFLAGLLFDSADGGFARKRRQTTGNSSVPQHVIYTIRGDQHKVGAERHRFSWVPGPESNYFYHMQYFHGFLQLQDLVDHAIIKLQTGVDAAPSTAFQEMPYPCHTKDQYQFNVGSYYFPIVMALAWMVAVGNGIAALISDKETGVDHVFRLLGLRSSMSWFAWFLNTFGSMIILSCIVLLILKIGQVMPAADASVLLVYLLLFSFSSTMLSYMISAFFTRATLGAMVGIIIYLITFLPIVIIVAVKQRLMFWENVVLSLSSTSAFCYGCKFLMLYEVQGVGIQWDNVEQEATENFTFSWILYMMLIDSAIYFIIGWYFRQVIPGKYMIPEKWYFPVSPSYWGCTCCKKNKYGASNKAIEHKNGIYPGIDRKDSIDEMDLPVGVSMQHLTKRYKKNALALDDLSVDLYEGAVTALLGHNGAGKTTTIRMLCGVYKPTSGVAYVGPYNTATQVNKIHKVLGFCAQEDVLIEHMTVYEHLKFFAGMRGISGKEKKKQVQKMLDSIKLRDCMHYKASKLSGGQRRRLSVGLAFLGGSKVVILDEPTAGVDPAARRLIWEIIAQHRAGRTILLSTHHMDEAEMIGDRILLLHKGRLLSYGSPLSLKTQYGSGYRLTIAKSNSEQDEDIDTKILNFLQGFISDASVQETRGQEVIFDLPHCDAMTMHDLMQGLEERRKDLCVYRYGISATDMEEVFMRVIDEADKNAPSKVTHDNLAFVPDQNGVEANGGTHIEMNNVSTTKENGCSLKTMQFGALLYKRFLHNIKDIRCYVTQLILPLIFILMALLASRLKPDRLQDISLMLTPALYTGDMYMFHRDQHHTPLSVAMEESLSKYNPWIATTCMPGSELEDLCVADPGSYLTPPLTPEQEALRLNPPECDCGGQFQECPDGASGLPPSRMMTATKDYLMNLTDTQFPTGEYLLRSHAEYKLDRYGGWSVEQDELGQLVGKTWFNNKGHHSPPAFYNGMSNMVLRGLLHQHGNMSWDQIKEYGITTYSHPLRSSLAELTSYNRFDSLADVGIATAILLGFCFVAASVVIYLIRERSSHEKQLQHIYGVGTFMYWSAAFLYDLLMYAFIAGLATGITYAFNLPTFSRPENVLAYFAIIMMFGWATIPFSYLLSRFFKDSTVGFMAVFIVHMTIAFNMACAKLMLDLLQGRSESIAEANRIVSYVFMIFPQYCLGEGLVRITVNQYISDQYARFGIERFTPPFTFEAINWLLIALAIEGIFFFILTLIADSPGLCRTSSKKRVLPADPNEDVDVSLERQRVVSGESRTEDVVTLFNLNKEYRKGFSKIPAVDNLSVGVKHGECFGLLGVNGAGKTTTFKMLTGELAPTKGAAYLLNKNITKNPSLLKQHVGYCPQFEALDPLLTVKQTISFFATLKGIPGSEHKMLCAVTAEKFGLKPFVNRKVKQLSGGTKRKLSAAVAMLGDPDVMLMDEPTTGMDPGARRLVWNNIMGAVKNNQSVILTSHSMAECDAICTRLAIMVNGKLMCLGSGQHLKNRFGGGYILRLRVAHDASVTDAMDQVDIAFPGSVLVHRHLTTLVMELTLSEEELSAPFRWLTEHQARLGIRDFSLTQTTMDQVFLHFATAQTDGSQEMERNNRRMSETINAWSRSSLGFIGDASSGFSNASTAGCSDNNRRPSIEAYSNPGYAAHNDNIMNSKLTCATPELAAKFTRDTHL